jgi:predicted TIM-barrel fold metal-dependent hydrolase
MIEIIDIHTHVGADTFFRGESLVLSRSTQQNIEQLHLLLTKYNVSKAMITPFPSPLAYKDKDVFWYYNENQGLLPYNSDKTLLFPSVNPRDSESIGYAKNLIKRNNLRGIKIHTRSCKLAPASVPRSVCRFAEELKIPILIHIGSGNEQELGVLGVDITLYSAEILAKSNPKTKFIFAHLGRLNVNLEDCLSLDNVFFDTSGLSLLEAKRQHFVSKHSHPELSILAAPQIINYLVQRGYEDKLLWGSDEPCGKSYESELEVVIGSGINSFAMRKILSENSKRLLNIC